MKIKPCSIFLLGVLIITGLLVSTAAVADYGEGFIAYRCSQNSQFEMTRRYIWNEELATLKPSIIDGKGIVKQRGTLLFNVLLRGAVIESSCNISGVNLKIRVGNLHTQSDPYSITLFENSSPIASFFTESASGFWNDEFKIRYSSQKKWEFFCGNKDVATWQSLTPEFNSAVCAISRVPVESVQPFTVPRVLPVECKPAYKKQLSKWQRNLYTAVNQEDVEAASRLLKMHHDVNFVGDDDFSLLIAIKKKNYRLAKLLLEAGATPNEVSCRGASALEVAIFDDSPNIVLLLLSAGADPNLGSNISTPLGTAALWGRAAIARQLLSNGAHPNYVSNANSVSPPLAVALNYDHFGLAEILLENGANPQFKLNTEETALYMAIGCLYPNSGLEEKRTSIVSSLIKHGADVNARTRGSAPLECARKHGYRKIEALLVAAGAK